MDWGMGSDEVDETKVFIKRLVEWKALADLLSTFFKELSNMELMCSKVFAKVFKMVEAQESQFEQFLGIVTEFKSVAEIMQRSHHTVGKLYEENGVNKLNLLSQKLGTELKRFKKTLSTETNRLTKERFAAQGTYLEFQKVHKRATNLSSLLPIDPWLMEAKVKKKIEDAIRAENDFKEAVLELHDDMKELNSSSATEVQSAVVDFSVLKKEQIVFIRDCMDKVAKVTLARFKGLEKPDYLTHLDSRMVPALTRRSYPQNVSYPERNSPFLQVVKQGFMMKMKVPLGYTRADVKEDRWESLITMVTECGFLHFFNLHDRLMTDPLHTINLKEAEISAELTMAASEGDHEEQNENPFVQASLRGGPNSHGTFQEDCCFEITASVPTPFFAAIIEKILVQSSNPMEAIDWLATLHFYKGQPGEDRPMPSPRKATMDFASLNIPAFSQQSLSLPQDASVPDSSFSHLSVDLPMSLNIKAPAAPEPRARSDTWPTASDLLRHGFLSERLIDLRTLEVTWEKRDVEVRHGKLTTFDVKDVTRKKSKWVMSLEGGQISVLDADYEEALLTPYGLRVFGNGNSVSFCCESEHERELWIQALRLACTWPMARRDHHFMDGDHHNVEGEHPYIYGEEKERDGAEEFGYMVSPAGSIYS